MVGEFNNVKIQGISAAVPSNVEDNMDYVNVLGERRTKKQIKLTGVAKRHVAGKYQRTSDFCYAAATALLDKLQWNKKDIKILVFITQSGNYKTPSTAFFMQKRLGLDKDCVVFDINLGCSSFNAGVHVVSALLQNCQESDKALLLIGDTSKQELAIEKRLNPNVIADHMIFGSAGAAIAMEKVKQHSIQFFTKSDGTGFDAIINHFGCPATMNGEKVFEFAINDVSDDVNAFKQQFNLEENIDYYVFHQAQKLILDNVADACNIPEDKELRSISEYGNTSGTSVAVSVCANIEKFIDKKSVKLFLCGFGIGLSWGAIYTEIPTENILPIIETDEHYDEDKLPDSDLQDKHILVMDADDNLGEYMSRYVKEQSASVIMAGMDEERLYEIQEDFILESHVIKTKENNAAFQDVVLYCQDNELTIDGILFPKQAADIEKYLKGIRFLQEAKLLTAQCSIVFLSDIEGLKAKNKEQYLQAKAKQEEIIALIQSELVEKQRVNTVLYDSFQSELPENTDNNEEWIIRYLRAGCPQEMMRQIYIGRAVEFLFSDESAYTTGALLPVNL